MLTPVSLALTLTILLMDTSPVHAQQWTEPQRAAWAAVERGWDALRSEDVDRFMDTFHPEFLGWHTAREAPYDLAAERSGTEAFLQRYQWVSHELEPLAVRVVGDVAVVHYQYREVVRERSGSGVHDETGRATQVMKLDGGRWRTLTIMSGPIPNG